MWGSLLCLFIVCVQAYREESFEIEFTPDDMRVSDACTLYTRAHPALTVIRFHHDGTRLNTSTYSEIIAINQDCSIVLFGFPDEVNTNPILAEGSGVVRVWRPGSEPVSIRPKINDISWIENTGYHYSADAIPLYRFGFSVDIADDTWIVGAPGQVKASGRDVGRPITLGYAFVYRDQELHSCRSLYETGCYPDSDTCALGYVNWKRYYGFYKYAPEDGKTMLQDTHNGDEVNAFQKKCIPEQLPYYIGGYYGGGPLNPVRVPYFQWQQFGYSVAITGSFNETAASIFVSAPGDTNRFIENNPHKEGRNYGRVYAWDLSADTPREKDIYWWAPSLLSPYGPPNLRTPHYQAYGRSIAASKSVLVVSSYPLYFNTREPFIIIYDCNPEQSNCEESENRGISIDNIPGNALRLTSDDLSYSDRALEGPMGYIKAPDYQNNMIGNDVGVTGSNVIITNKHHTFMGESHPQAHRFGKDSRLRETHDYRHSAQYGTNTQHWVLANHQEVTHYWPCDLGYTGEKPTSFETTDVSKRGELCVACDTAYYSDDGWLEECDLCPVNKTTYEEAQSECKPVVRATYEGISWEDACTIIIILSVGVIGLWLLCVGCQYACYKGKIPCYRGRTERT